MSKKILSKPLLYLSTFFEKNKGLYYDNLTFVRTKNEMKQWLKYFLVGIAEIAENAVQTLSSVIELKLKLEDEIIKNFGRKANNAQILLQYLFERPVVDVNQVKGLTNTTFKTANDLVAEFLEAGILVQTTNTLGIEYFCLKNT